MLIEKLQPHAITKPIDCWKSLWLQRTTQHHTNHV